MSRSSARIIFAKASLARRSASSVLSLRESALAAEIGIARHRAKSGKRRVRITGYMSGICPPPDPIRRAMPALAHHNSSGTATPGSQLDTFSAVLALMARHHGEFETMSGSSRHPFTQDRDAFDTLGNETVQ